MRRLVSAGADVNLPNRYGETPFYCACYGGHLAVVETLLAVKGCRYRESGEENLRPINLASTRGHTAIVRAIRRFERWRVQRLLWLGHLKGRQDRSPLALLSQETLLRIIKYAQPPSRF